MVKIDAISIADHLPDFADVPLTRAAWLAIGREFLGLPYHPKNTFVEWDKSGNARGVCNCYGLLFLMAQRAGFVDEGFWAAWELATARFGVARTLHAYLSRQLQDVGPSQVLPGDTLLFRWNGAGRTFGSEDAAWVQGHHHLAILSDLEPRPLGSVLQSVDTAADLSGAVYETVLGARDWAQLHRAGVLRQFVD